MVKKKLAGMDTQLSLREQKEKLKKEETAKLPSEKDLVKIAKETWGVQFKSISEIKMDHDDGGHFLNFYVEGDATEIRKTLPLIWEGQRIVVTQYTSGA